MKRTSFLLGVGAFRPKLYGNGVIPCQNVDTVWYVVDDATTTLPLEAFRLRNFVADFKCFFVKIYAKNGKFWYMKPISGEVRGDTRPWLMVRWKVHGWVSSHHNWTFFAIYYGSGVMRLNVYSSAVFTGVNLFALKFLLDRVVPINHCGHEKTRDTGLPDGEDCVPSFWHNIRVWWTDRRICHSIYSACKEKLCFAGCYKNEQYRESTQQTCIQIRTAD